MMRLRSFQRSSWISARWPFPHIRLLKRSGSSASLRGEASNGASSRKIVSRMGTSLRGSPPSAASTQETVAGGCGRLARRGVERGVEQEDRVADGDVFARIAAVGGFDPGNSGGRVAAPVEFAGTGLDRIVNIRNRVF